MQGSGLEKMLQYEQLSKYKCNIWTGQLSWMSSCSSVAFLNVYLYKLCPIITGWFYWLIRSLKYLLETIKIDSVGRWW